MHYYNEYDKHAASWLRELIADGLIPAGHVDERSITDIQPSDLEGYVQCHFFAGIGGWPLALQLAGWPVDRPVWTGSCPCQPYSNAGKGLGDADPRNLWPVFFNLIRQCRPEYVFGEQVESAIRHGWLDGVSADLEGEGYACGAVVLGAHSVGSPHIRQRLYWVADYQRGGREVEIQHIESGASETGEREADGSRSNSHAGGMANSVCLHADRTRFSASNDGGKLSYADEIQRKLDHWSSTTWHTCRDGKHRRIPSEPSLFPLAHGIPGRVGLLRGSGNAIVPQAAASFIQAMMEEQP